METKKLRLYQGPENRDGCKDVPRPCVHVGCRFNNYLNVSDYGTIKIQGDPNVPPEERDPMTSCALDMADAGKWNLKEIGNTIGLGAERVRQIEEEAKDHVKRRAPAELLAALGIRKRKNVGGTGGGSTPPR